MIVVVIAEGVVILLLTVLVIGLLRSHAEILRRLHDLGAGVYDENNGASAPVDFTPAPGVPSPRENETDAVDLTGSTPAGGALAVAVRGTDHSTLLAFLSSGCTTCQAFWDAFRREDLDDLPGRNTRLVVITKGEDTESPAAIAELAPAGVTTIMSSPAWQQYEVPVSPYFILVDGTTSSVIGEGAAASWTQVRNLLEQACADIGLTTEGTPRPQRLGGDDREARADGELRRAGIGPGDPALYQSTVRAEGDER